MKILVKKLGAHGTSEAYITGFVVWFSRRCSLRASPSSSDAEFPEVDPDQPRQLREKNLIRGPVKYTSQFADVPSRVCLNS